MKNGTRHIIVYTGWMLIFAAVFYWFLYQMVGLNPKALIALYLLLAIAGGLVQWVGYYTERITDFKRRAKFRAITAACVAIGAMIVIVSWGVMEQPGDWLARVVGVLVAVLGTSVAAWLAYRTVTSGR